MMTIRCTAADLDKRPQNKERVNNISLSLHRRSCTRWSSQSAHHLLNTSIREEDEDGGRWRGNDYCKYMTMCLVSFFFCQLSRAQGDWAWRKFDEMGASRLLSSVFSYFFFFFFFLFVQLLFNKWNYEPDKSTPPRTLRGSRGGSSVPLFPFPFFTFNV